MDEGNGHTEDGTRARRVLTEISSRSWEHPADRAALVSLRKIPAFDSVLRALYGFFGEKPTRLAFQANAVQVTPRQFPRIHVLYEEVLHTLDSPKPYELFVSQTQEVNAGAWGMKRPFIILNSAMVELLEDDELAYVMGHELGHIMSDHVLYKTMMYLLMQLAELNYPIVGIGARVVLVGLLEWYRKSELSCDRAGLLAIQDPQAVMETMLKLAGGVRPLGDGTPAHETNLDEFIRQAEAYRETGDVADSVFKILNLLGATHPFAVLRVAEIRTWIESGDYDRILRGEYQRRGDPDPKVAEDIAKASKAYKDGAQNVASQMKDAAKRTVDSIRDSLRRNE